MRKLTLPAFLAMIFTTGVLSAQHVAINETGALPHPSAILDVQSTSKGLLVPRMTAVQKSAIDSPATGLMIFQTDEVSGYYYFNGVSWTQLGANGGFWSANGDHIFNTNSGRVGIGANDPLAKLEIRNSGPGKDFLINGSDDGWAGMSFRVDQPGPLQWGEFSVTAGKSGEKRHLNIFYDFFNFDFIARQQLLTLNPGSDTAMTVHGGMLAKGPVVINDEGGDNPVLLMETSDEQSNRITMRHNVTPTSHNEFQITSTNNRIDINKVSYSEPTPETAISSIAPVVQLGGTRAINAFGSVNIASGELNHSGKTGSANLLPIAYGTILANSAVQASTGNFICLWNNTYKRYEITIEGEDYYYLNYITCVTPAGDVARTKVGSVSGKLLI
ncbi:MAG: hypothetical protein HUU01_18710, partial [Saprospiraceae bacterium]|nr:hypothetical protein [Saprospiraceae bacterium]